MSQSKTVTAARVSETLGKVGLGLILASAIAVVLAQLLVVTADTHLIVASIAMTGVSFIAGSIVSDRVINQ